jgi:ArsR family transcriptional regulator
MATVSAAVSTLQLLGEPTRVRLLALLAREELTVAELVAITDLPQSSVSAHLARLREAGLLRDRKSGASTFYALGAAMPEDARKVWALLEADLDDRLLDADRARTVQVLRGRRNAEAWPDAVAGEMERHYSPGRTWEATAHGFLSLARLGDVLDAGSGDGTIAQMIAPRARSVTCLDRSEKMIAAARQRLARSKNVTFAVGDVQRMPFEARAFDAVLLFNVLTHAEDPARAVAEAARVLRPDGLLAIVTLAPHKHPDVTAPYGDVHPGFSTEKLRGMLKRAGFTVENCEITSREKRAPNFEVVTASARLPGEDG